MGKSMTMPRNSGEDWWGNTMPIVGESTSKH